MAVWAFVRKESCVYQRFAPRFRSPGIVTKGGSSMNQNQQWRISIIQYSSLIHIPPMFDCLPTGLLPSLQDHLPTFLLHFLCSYYLSTRCSVLCESFWDLSVYFLLTILRHWLTYWLNTLQRNGDFEESWRRRSMVSASLVTPFFLLVTFFTSRLWPHLLLWQVRTCLLPAKRRTKRDRI